MPKDTWAIVVYLCFGSNSRNIGKQQQMPITICFHFTLKHGHFLEQMCPSLDWTVAISNSSLSSLGLQLFKHEKESCSTRQIFAHVFKHGGKHWQQTWWAMKKKEKVIWNLFSPHLESARCWLVQSLQSCNHSQGSAPWWHKQKTEVVLVHPQALGQGWQPSGFSFANHQLSDFSF